MKKMLALLTALMLALGCCPAFARANADPADYVGYWALDAVETMGFTFNAEELGWSGFLGIHAEGTAVLSTTGENFILLKAGFDDGAYLQTNDGTHMPMTLGENGALSFRLVTDEIDCVLSFSRAVAPELPLATPFLGQWVLTELIHNGMSASGIDQAETMYINVYDDHFIVMHFGEEYLLVRMEQQNGKLIAKDRSGNVMSITMRENGDLYCVIDKPGEKMEVIARRDGQAQAETPAAAQTASAPASAANPFLGTWEAVGAVFMGLEFTLEDIGWGEMTLVIESNVAYLNIDGEGGSCPTIFVDGTCIFTDGEEQVVCTIGEDGYMYVAITSQGLTLSIKMLRTAAPVAEEAPAAAEADPFDGVWTAQTFDLMGLQFAAQDLGMSVTLTVTGNTAVLEVSGDKARCTVTRSGNTLTLFDGVDTLVCTVDENGVLTTELEADGLTLVMRMTRENAPVAEATPVADETPAAEADPFDGVWTAQTFDLMGLQFAAQDLGMSVTLTVTGSTAVLEVSGDKARCTVTRSGNTLTLFDGVDTLVCTVDENGVLTTELQADGLTLVMRMTRENAPVAEAPAASATTNPFNGVWMAQTFELSGMIIPADALGMEVCVTIDGTQGCLMTADVEANCIVSWTDSTCTFFDGVQEMVFTLGEDGLISTTIAADGVELVMYLSREMAEEPAAPVVVETRTARAEGFIDYVGVTVGLAADGTIVTLEIDVSGELPPLCELVLEDSFINQFIGKKGPFVVGENVDVATGATFSSRGAINAINSLFPENAEESVAGNALTAQAEGFMDGAIVTVTLNEDGSIATLNIDVSGELAPVCNNVLVDSFVNQFIGKTAPFVLGQNVDGVTGATFTSRSVVDGLNQIVPVGENAYTGTANGFQSVVTVTLTVENGVITTFQADTANETHGIGHWCGIDDEYLAQFVGKSAMAPLGAGIDALTGATVTSNAVVDAANDALSKMPVEAPAAEAPANNDNALANFLYGNSAPAVEEPTVVEEPVIEEPVADEPADAANALANFLYGSSAPVVEEPATEVPVVAFNGDFTGTWYVVYVEEAGQLTAVATRGVTGTLTVYVESARWTLGKNSALGVVSRTDSALRMTTVDGDYTFTRNEHGYLCLPTTMNGTAVVLWLSPNEVAEPVENPVVEEPVAQAPAQTVSGNYDGRWLIVSVQAMGMTFAPAELSMSGYELVISGDTAQFIINGTVAIDGRVVEANGAVQVTDGVNNMPFTLDAQGRMQLQKLESGVTMVLTMQREGGAPAAAAPAVEAPAPAAEATCQFCGQTYAADQGYTYGSLVVCPSCYERFFR